MNDAKTRRIMLEIHDARQELPDHSAECIAFSCSGERFDSFLEIDKTRLDIYNMAQVSYSLKHKCFCAHDDGDAPDDDRRRTWADVRFWAYYAPLKAKLEKGEK